MRDQLGGSDAESDPPYSTLTWHRPAGRAQRSSRHDGQAGTTVKPARRSSPAAPYPRLAMARRGTAGRRPEGAERKGRHGAGSLTYRSPAVGDAGRPASGVGRMSSYVQLREGDQARRHATALASCTHARTGRVPRITAPSTREFGSHLRWGRYEYLLAACNESPGTRRLSLPITSSTLTVTAVRSYSAQCGLPYDRRL
jgi:hypothetical protein